MKLDAAQLRDYEPSQQEIDSIKRKPIYIIIDNVLDTYNVGAIFRLADAVAVRGVFLVGKTDVPTDEKVGHKIQKASVGTWKWIHWEHTETVRGAISKIRNTKYEIPDTKLQIIAIEQHKNSIPYTEYKYEYPLALILGHETTGVSEEGLKLADEIVEIPMFGVNKSLNVMVSLGLVMWEAIKNK